MQKFIVTTDSSCDLTKKQVEDMNVKCAFMTYTIDDVVFYDDMIDEHINEFYEKMEAGAAPKTSQVPPADFVEFFTKVIEKNTENLPILHVSVGSSLSGTYQSAMTAIGMLTEDYPNLDIRVVDTTVSSAGLAMLVVEAVKYRDKGRTIEETIVRLDAIKEHVNTYITTNDLTYLCRGGRVSKAGAVLGSFLSINPVITLSRGGKLYVTTKVRGSSATTKKFCSLIGDTVLRPESQTLYMMHANALERAKELGNMLKEKYGFKDIMYLKFGTTIGSHAGPGLVAAFYFGKMRTHRLKPV